MPIKKLHFIYFSPCGHTRELAGMLASALASNCGITPRAHDATPLHANLAMNLAADELAIFAAPVFGGRLPALAVERFKKARGNSSPAIVLVTYGNRAYEDALLELGDLALAGGFVPIAAAACIAEHTIISKCASGRPNLMDKSGMEKFAAAIHELLQGNWREAPISIPGEHPYKEFKRAPLPQSVDQNCLQCGICSLNCPAGAIDFENSANVDKEKCICCMRCVYVCPQKARHPAQAFLEAVGRKLAPFCGEQKENEYILAESH